MVSNTVVLLNTGKVLACGRNNYGQLGYPTNSGTDTPNTELLEMENITGYNGKMQLQLVVVIIIQLFC